jgi:hypothetical protein
MVAALLLGAMLLGTPLVALALDPVTVEVEGVVKLNDANASTARDRAFQAALLEAVLEVVRRYVPAARLELDRELFREALAPGAAAAILTYRVHPDSGPRVSASDLVSREYAVGLTASVDAAQVRAQLQSLRLVADSRERPSVVLLVRPDRTAPASDSALVGLEDSVKQRLAGEGFVIVEPALRRGGLDASSAVGFARALGADVGVDVSARWRERGVGGRVLGGTLALEVRALRVEDGFEVAIARFEAPAYHDDPAEAQVRAAEALQRQLADNLLLQLERNWEALADPGRPIRVVLSSVTSLWQAERVSDALRGPLRAESVAIAAIAPRVVELRVEAPLSPGALQDRLASLPFDGFRLEPVEVERNRVELRVALEPELPPASAP